MTGTDDAIFNARNGERMRFERGATGALLRIETPNPPHPAEPEHTHPQQESSVEVLSGVLHFSVRGAVRAVGAGRRSSSRSAPRTRSGARARKRRAQSRSSAPPCRPRTSSAPTSPWRATGIWTRRACPRSSNSRCSSPRSLTRFAPPGHRGRCSGCSRRFWVRAPAGGDTAPSIHSATSVGTGQTCVHELLPSMP